MGTSDTSTAFAADLGKLVLALWLVLDIQANPGKCGIFADSQADIHYMMSPKCASGHYILAKATQVLGELRRRRWDVQLWWIPAHTGVQGNKEAERAAKEDAGHDPNAQ
ncbi:hypothetical protein G7Z17_g1820 [Cylindrodendrum hubeiense]|uniref:RNase H type-1 domain-containing protein n=1 Tax=Cylindrodendrum hubeiense TaxID=595255 RepID=A0A9P5HM46_9HYPO|nr:hypothetical protein G7Z17_g1820 [Cylindrodendrum hubeiense]